MLFYTVPFSFLPSSLQRAKYESVRIFSNVHETVLLIALMIQLFLVSFVLMFYQMHFDHASGAYFDFGNHTEKVCCLHLAFLDEVYFSGNLFTNKSCMLHVFHSIWHYMLMRQILVHILLQLLLLSYIFL